MLWEKVIGSLSVVPFTGPFNLYSWGANNWGSVGDGTSATIAEPTPVDALSDWAQVSSSLFTSTSFPQHSLFVKTDGTLWAIGSNDYGQLGDNTTVGKSSPVQIGTMSNWSQVACGTSFSLARKTDNKIWSWGRNNNFGQLGHGDLINRSSPVQIGSINWAEISAGVDYCLARRTGASSTLFAWGRNGFGELGNNDTSNKSFPTQIGSGSWIAISAGQGFSLGIRNNGTLYAWGNNFAGQLGDNTRLNKSSPIQVGSLGTWSKVSAGTAASLGPSHAIKTDGTLWGWGGGSLLGAGDGEPGRSSPVQIGALSGWSQVDNGNHTLAIKTDGTLWAWGSADAGQLGTGSGFVRSPVQVGSLTNWTKISTGGGGGPAGFSHAIGGGELYAWGANLNGVLGVPIIRPSSPVQIGSDEWLQVSYGTNFTVAIKDDNSLWAWGRGNVGQLGNNEGNSTVSVPNQIGALTDWEQVSAGSSHCLAYKTDGTLWTWGLNNTGQLGDNTIIAKSSPVQIGALSDWAQVSAGGSHCLALKTDGTLWAWGNNSSGQIGIRNRINRSSPVQIGALSDWAQVSAGTSTSLALKTNGTLWTWGFNNQGALGTNNTINRSSPIQVGALSDWAQVSGGDNFSLAYKTNGTIWAWGSNFSGNLGDGTTINRLSPVQIGALSDWAQVAGGSSSSLAVKADGTLWTWGRGLEGQLADNTNTNKSSPVQVGALTDWQRTPLGARTSTLGALSS